MDGELRFPTELKLWKYKIERLARRFGLDFHPTMYIIVTPQEMSELAARHGFPTTPHHWRYGQESLWMKKEFRFGLGKIYEMVLNSVPGYAYLLKLNDEITQKSVMAHVCGHVDMHKNNAYLYPTNRNMINAFAQDALRLDRIFELFGRDRAKEFYDWVLSFEWFIDQNSLYIRREAPPKSERERIRELEEKKIPRRIVSKEELPAYMDEFLNPPEWLEEERLRLAEETQEEIDIERGAVIPPEPAKDILLFLLRYAPLEPWQKNLISMVRRHSYYFAPQGRINLMNEGWASFWQEEIMNEAGMVGSHELFQFAEELAGVQRRHRSINPYRLGYELWKNIKFRYDTGRHGDLWEKCEFSSIKERWDEFAVFKTLYDRHASDPQELEKRWDEFSAFVGELKAGELGYPRELFVRNLFTKEYLIITWLRYLEADREYEKFLQMKEEMEPLELQASLLAAELRRSYPEDSEEELKLKARRDIYEQSGRSDLWLWTPDEIKREAAALKVLLRFRERWHAGLLHHSPIPISPEWLEWARRFEEKLKLGRGLEKIFEVRSTHDDFTFLEEFFTQEFCEEHQYFLYKAKKVWDYQSAAQRKRYVIESRSFRRIKKRLLFQYTNFHLPIIRVADANYDNNGELYLRHEHRGVDLDFWSKDEMYMKDVLVRLFWLWGGKKRVHLETIVTKKKEDRPWWFTWHQTDEKTADEEDQELEGTVTVFSYGFKRMSRQVGGHVEEYESDIKELTRKGLDEVTFPAPF